MVVDHIPMFDGDGDGNDDGVNDVKDVIFCHGMELDLFVVQDSGSILCHVRAWSDDVTSVSGAS